MKKLIHILPLFLCLTLISCEKIKDLLTFEISESENIQIPASGIINPPLISPVPVAMSSQETFENNNTKASLVKNVSLTKLSLTIIDIKIYIGTDESDKVLLASLDNIPMDVATIELVPSNSKLDTYIKAESYTLYTEVSLRSGVADELTVRADSKFKVTADPL
jgi:hypothetical protein